jgi:hypothetical protein
LASYRILERGYISDVEVCEVVGGNIRNIPKGGGLVKLLFLAFGVNIFRECLLYVLELENSKTLDRLTWSAMFRRTE